MASHPLTFAAYVSDGDLKIASDFEVNGAAAIIHSYPIGQLLAAFAALPEASIEELILLRTKSSNSLTAKSKQLWQQQAAIILTLIKEEATTLANDTREKKSLLRRLKKKQDHYQAFLSWHHKKDLGDFQPEHFPGGLNAYAQKTLQSRHLCLKSSGKRRLQSAYLIHSLDELLHLDSTVFWTKDFELARCELCQRYFILRQKEHYLYCEWPSKQGETCRKRGPSERYQRRLNKDPVLREYRRVYRREYARQERSLNKSPTPVKSVAELTSFQAWSEKAQALRQSYLRSEIDAADCLAGLARLEKETAADSLYANQPPPGN